MDLSYSNGKLLSIEFKVGVVNGEGWSSPEVSKHKDVQGRLTLKPTKSLLLSVYVNKGQYDTGEERNRFAASMALVTKYFMLGGEYFGAKDPANKLKTPLNLNGIVGANGASVFSWIDSGLLGLEGIRLVARLDVFDPSTTLNNNAHTREILGVGYNWNNLSLLLDADLVQDQRSGIPDQKTLFLHTQVTF